MGKRLIKLTAALSAILVPVPLLGVDIENGDDLHFENCTGCHDETIYAHDHSRVKTMERLVLQVRYCKDTLELSWFAEDVDDVAAYLDQNYYRFQ